jgi:DNA-binding MarR family transcriptional regulator
MSRRKQAAAKPDRAPADRPAVPPLIGVMLRVPAQAIQRRLMDGLNASGFPDLLLAHMPVLQYPGPNGCRPVELAQRAGMSKQAMNQLLQSLERLGYISRTDAADDGRARSVRFTKRGEAAWMRMTELLTTIEAEWRATLGAERFDLLKRLLGDVWQSELIHPPALAASLKRSDAEGKPKARRRGRDA